MVLENRVLRVQQNPLVFMTHDTVAFSYQFKNSV